MLLSWKKVALYIQQSLYDGRQPVHEGFYCFRKKELCEMSGISASSFGTNLEELLDYFQRWCDFDTWARFPELRGEKLYQDVSYEKGVFRFRRNPLTFQPEYIFLWALPPLNANFAYDSFDEKHRRRNNAGRIVYDSIPWTWNADDYEEEIRKAREDIQKHWSQDER